MKKATLLIVLLVCITVSAFNQNSTLTIREVFDFQPGDIFHCKITHLYSAPPAAIRFEVLTRNTSPGNDTICYTLRHFDYYSYGSASQLTYTHKNYLKDVCYTNLDSLVHTLIDTPWITTPVNSFLDSTFKNPQLCDSLTYRYEARYGYYFEPAFVWRAYSKGLGITDYLYHYYYSWPPTHEQWKVVYYKKGPVDCGQPDTVSTGIAKSENASGLFISYPNPVKSYLNIEFDETMESKDLELILRNIYGHVVLYRKVARGTHTCSVNINELPPGTYILQVSGNGVPVVSRKIFKGG